MSENKSENLVISQILQDLEDKHILTPKSEVENQDKNLKMKIEFSSLDEMMEFCVESLVFFIAGEKSKKETLQLIKKYLKKEKEIKRLKRNKERMEAFLDSTLKVSKAGLNSQFNTISKEKENDFIRAVIDENVKGYSGSRIRFRLLEDVYVGKNRKIDKGTILYGQISGFNMQRVKLNIVSVLYKGEILPINLTIYDNDGMEGLYVPQSAFREMVNEFGSNSMQGQNMSSGSGEGFFTSMWSKLFQSTSTTIANLIRKNKVKLKYNSYVYLINEQELQERNNNRN